MFDRAKAAEFLVVAWCKEWKLGEYLDVVMEQSVQHELTHELVVEAAEAFPWLPVRFKPYSYSVREFVGGAYPKLSEWLWARADDAARLKCSAQVQRLKAPKWLAGFVRPEDRREMKESGADQRAADASYRLSRDAFKTHGRGAWNVCKA